MITTGIIRKIDELGRIVVPKEIRKNLNIKNSDDLEILVEQDKIILKKYNKMDSLKSELNKYVELINEFTSFTIIVTDLEKIILTNKIEYKDILNQEVTKNYLLLINQRKKVIVNNINTIQITNRLNINTKYCVIPIIVNANLLGSFIIMSSEEITDKSLIIINIILKLIRNSWIC